MAVKTGFSKPYVAVYGASGGTIAYTDGAILARGVNVTVSPESSDDNKFYADNQAVESAAGIFTGGTVTLEVDGLESAAYRLIYGLPTAETDGGVDFNDDMAIPYVGVGYIYRAQRDGVVKYYPTVIYKCRFNLPELSAATQEDSIDWQTQSLEATIFRADDAKHKWLWMHEAGFTTESAAETALRTKLNIANS